MLAFLIALAAQTAAPKTPPSTPTAKLPAEIVGTWCIQSDPLLFQKKPRTEAELQQRFLLARDAEFVRLTIADDGTTSLSSRDPAVARGRLRLARGAESDSIDAIFDWAPTPTQRPFSTATLSIGATEEGVLLLSDGADVFQLARDDARGRCWQLPRNVGAPQEPPPPLPQVVLTHEATFTGGRALHGASAWLLKRGETVYVATARHLLGDAGGVNPPVPANELPSQLERWRLFVRTQPDAFVEAGPLGMPLASGDVDDWLLLQLKTSPPRAGRLPVTPLQLRKERVHVGETVFLVGCAYREAACKQRLYRAQVSGRLGNRFRLLLDENEDMRGFSGAPIVDVKGLAVGFMTIGFSTITLEQLNLESGGEDIPPLQDPLPERR